MVSERKSGLTQVLDSLSTVMLTMPKCIVEWRAAYGLNVAIERSPLEEASVILQSLQSSPVLVPMDQRNSVTGFCLALHYENFRIWCAEDVARGNAEPQIVAAKRLIDKHNQLRNDLIETVDEQIMYRLTLEPTLEPTGTQPVFNTETTGSIVDRLSVLALKIFHTTLLIANDHPRSTELLTRIKTLSEQRDFLYNQLRDLCDGIVTGRRMTRPFRQLKLYNNPDFNKHIKHEH